MSLVTVTSGPSATRWTALHLLVLGALFVGSPILDVFGTDAIPFLAVGADSFDLVVFAVVVTLAPGLLLVASLLVFSRLFSGWRAHVAVVHILLVAAIAVRVLLRREVPTGGRLLIIVIPLVVAAVFAVLYARFAVVRSLCSWAAFGAVLVPVLFLMSTAADHTRSLRQSTEVGAAEAPTPVAILIFDEFPLTTILDSDAEIERDRFPNFAWLADTSTWYRNTTTVADRTWNALPSVFSGTRPDVGTGLARGGASFLSNIAASHDLRFQDFGDICPENACSFRGRSRPARLGQLVSNALTVAGHQVLPSGFTDDLQPINEIGVRVGGSEFRRLISAATVGTPNTASVDHVLPPHGPWNRYDGREYAHDEMDAGRVNGIWTTDEALVRHYYQRHQIEALTADALLGELLAAVDELRADDALVIVMADHGSAFVPGESMRGAHATTDVLNIANVPLFVRYPGQSDKVVVDDPVELIDLAPTVLDLLDAPELADLDGLILPRVAGDGDSDRRRVLVPNNGGEIDITTGIDDLAASARRKFAFTGLAESGSFLERFFAPGPGEDLLGSRIAPGRRTTDVVVSARVSAGLPHVLRQPVALDAGWWIVALDGEAIATAEVANGQIYGVVSPRDTDYDAADLTFTPIE